jgi:hypothetical protein
MKRPSFHLRDLFWLVLVVGMGLGWWLDQDRIRREALGLQALPVKSAEVNLRVAEAELAQIKGMNQRAICVSVEEFRRTQLQVEVAKAELETARARQVYFPSP